jgi:hypothetical protein
MMSLMLILLAGQLGFMGVLLGFMMRIQQRQNQLKPIAVKVRDKK